MAKRVITITVLFLLGVFSVSVASAGVQPVYDCGTTLAEPGKYKLMNDLVGCPVVGVWIVGSDITLDLNGHSITCEANAIRNGGVVAWDLDGQILHNVTIKNGHVSNCSDGIMLAGAVDSQIMKMNSTGNRVWIYPNGDEASGTGITIWFSEGSRIMHNELHGNALQGIGVWDSTGTLIKHNTLTGNPFAGIWTARVDDTEISCNRAHGNGTGIGLGPSSTGGLVKGNLATENWSDGISAWAWAWDGFPFTELPSGNTFKHNISEANGWGDHAEALYDLFTGDIFTNPDDMCRNTWFENQFHSSFGPNDCIGYRFELDDDDVCALDDD